MGHFARECRVPRSKDNRNWNQGNSSKAVRIEDASEKAMCAIDGGGFDVVCMAEDCVQAKHGSHWHSLTLSATIKEVEKPKKIKMDKEKLFNQANNDSLGRPKKTSENMDGTQLLKIGLSDEEEDVKSISIGREGKLCTARNMSGNNCSTLRFQRICWRICKFWFDEEQMGEESLVKVCKKVSESTYLLKKIRLFIFMPIWKVMLHTLKDILPQSVVCTITRSDGTHVDCSFQDDGIEDHQLILLLLKINGDKFLPLKTHNEEDQGIEFGDFHPSYAVSTTPHYKNSQGSSLII
ncbi:hypothetical protein Tco_0522504 [Tanacetum coccineum]